MTNDKLRLVVLFSVAFLAIASAVATAKGEAQVLNPAFIRARDLYNQADAETRRQMLNHWIQLSNEQKELWRLAGDVDRLNAQRQPIPWLGSYNARIVSWQNDLGSFSASLQLKSVEHHSTEAEKLLPKNPDGELEPASAEARKGFDDHGEPSGHLDAVHTTSAGNPMRDPVIPKEEYLRDSVVAKAVNDREVAKKQWEKAEAELKTLAPTDPKNHLRIVELREKSDTAKNKVIYDNFSIGDRVNSLSKETKSQ
jgi:hypothetical protein